MLERASSCLENGGRQLLRSPQRCTRSRRMLHLSFWHHGASDLDLPIWWASADSPNRNARNDDDFQDTRSSAEVCNGQRCLTLDFLYPAKTMALIQRFSKSDWEHWEHRRGRTTCGNGARQFSSTRTKKKEQYDSDFDGKSMRSDRELDEGTEPLNELRKLLFLQEEGKEDLAWKLYSNIREYNRDASLRADVLDYISLSDSTVDGHKLLRVFESLPSEYRRPSSYRAAVIAYLDLQMVGQAVKLHEEAADKAMSAHFGTDILLARTVQDNQWDLALQVFGSYKRFRTRQRLAQIVDKEDVWDLVAELPNLNNHLISLLRYAQQFEHHIQSSKERKESLQLFVDGLVYRVIGEALSASNPNEDFIFNLFRGLRALSLSKAYHYEVTIKRMLSMPRYQEYTNQRKIFIDLYTLFIDEGFRPSPHLIFALIQQLSKHQSLNDRTSWTLTVSRLVKDFRMFHGAFNNTQLLSLMIMFARQGYVDEVYGFFNEVLAQTTDQVEQKYLMPLLYVHARRADVLATKRQFDRITNEFNLTPNIISWNFLLYSHARADDLDGVIQCFSDIMQSGVRPTERTFATIVNFCAKRGDVDTIQSLFHEANELGVAINTEMRSSLVLAFANNDDMEAAEASAERMIRDQHAGVLQGPMTPAWNTLLTNWAIRRDLKATTRMYRRMQQLGIPLDSWTYSALMRALIAVRQTNAAYKLLRVTMPNENVRVHGFHYALCINGFMAEGQLHRALHAGKRMADRNIKPTITTRMVLLKAMALKGLKGSDQSGDFRSRLIEVEEGLREILLESDPSDLAISQPHLSRYGTPRTQLAPEGYFEFLVILYGNRGAYDLCKELFQAAAVECEDEEGHYEAPIGLLTALMQTHFRQKEWDEVKKCWDLARVQADKLSKQMSALRNPPASTPENTLNDENFLAAHTPYQPPEAAKIAQNRRAILIHPTKFFIRSLIAQRDKDALAQVQSTIYRLLSEGYIIDSLVWNEFIQLLARFGRLVDAFTACEYYLMPNFAGWRPRNMWSKEIPAYRHMLVRSEHLRKNLLMPRYLTLVILSAAWSYVKKGGVFEGQQREEGWAEAVLLDVAPQTIRAIETMPVVPRDLLQQRYLMDL